jgi:hypothetical protein
MKRLIHGAGDSRFAALRQTERAPAREARRPAGSRAPIRMWEWRFAVLLHRGQKIFPVKYRKNTGA